MEDSQSLKDKGNKFFASNDLYQAIQCYTQAIKVDPQNHILYSNRSAAYLSAQEHQKALEDAQKCLEIKPDFPKGLLRLGDAQVSLSKFKEASVTYTACIAIGDSTVVKFAEAGLQKTKIKDFYLELTATKEVEVKYINEKKGKGMFATRDFKSGEIIFQEDAFISALDPECDKAKVCDHCMCFVEPIDSQLARSRLKLSASEQDSVQKCEIPKPFLCPECNTTYCSDTCYTTAKNLYHTKLCVPTSKFDHPLIKYRNLIKDGPTSTTFSLAERIFAIIATNLSNETSKNSNISNTLDVDALLGPLRHVQRNSLMMTQPQYNGNNLDLLQSHLSGPLNLLKDALFPGSNHVLVHNVITERLFDEILGMISQNNTTAYVLPPFFHLLKRPEKEVAHARAHGMCVFLLHSCINHSCSPNDKVKRAQVVIRTIKPVKKDEELVFTYIDENQSTKIRIAELQSKYGFTCNCPRCK